MIPGFTPEIERILEAGNSAPSGENCQPWRFLIKGNTIEVHLLPDRDQSAYSWGQRASYIACGAVIENIVLAASIEGFQTIVQYFTAKDDGWHIATLELKKDSAIKHDPLAPFIAKRISNRKPYRKDSLTNEERSALIEASGGALVLKEETEILKRLGRVGSTNEEIMLANKPLHNFFFSHVSWTKEEDEKNKIGFYIKTLELPPPAQAMFKLFRNWSLMRILAGLGFNRIVAEQNAATNAAASAIGALTVASLEPIEFVKLGRTVERVWLAATQLGLAFQPLTGVLFFKLWIDGGKGGLFSKAEQERINTAYQEAGGIFDAKNKHLAFMFRVGHGDAPSAHAIRFPLVDTVTVIS